MKRPDVHGAKVKPSRDRALTVARRSAAAADPRSRLKQAERDEARRFTASSRRVAQVRLAIVGGFLSLVGAVAAVVVSPLMALEVVEVSGLVSLDETVVIGAVAEQQGTPLALVDYDDITRKLGTVPQIESFATELRPPHTLVIRVVERVAIGTIRLATGFDVIDAAGVVIGYSESEPPALPAIYAAEADGVSFDSIVTTLAALPPALRSDVKAISAESRDSVSFVLRSVPHQIRWGSNEKSTQKAAVLEKALVVATSRGGTYIIDVSAPDTLVMKPAK